MRQAKEDASGRTALWKALFYSAFVIELGIVAILTYALPSNILTATPLLEQGIEWLSIYVTGLVRYDRLSEFPEVAQLVWTVQLLLIPFWAVLAVKASKPNFTAMRRKRLMIVSGVLMMAIFGLFVIFYVPTTPSPGGIVGGPDVNQYLLNSKAGFVFWSVFMTMAAGGSFGIVFMFFKGISKMFGRSRDA